MGILDWFYTRAAPQPEPAAQQSAPPTVPDPVPTEEMGAVGARLWGGYAHQNERNPEMVGERRYAKMTENATNIAIIGTAVRRSEQLIRSVEWTMAPARGAGIDEAAAQEMAEFAEHAVLRSPSQSWAEIAARAGSGEYLGNSVQEMTVRIEDAGRWKGRFVLADVAWRPPHTISRWNQDQHGALLGVWQRQPDGGDEVYIPRWKVLYHSDQTLSSDPAGVGLLRGVAEVARQLMALVQLEGKGFTNSVNGNMVGYVPEAEIAKLAKDKQAEALSGIKGYLENHRRKDDLALTLDSSTYKNTDGTLSAVRKWGMEVLKAENDLKELGEAIWRKVWEIAIALNIEHIVIGAKGGSLAMQSQKSMDFYRLIMGILQAIAHAVKRDVLGLIWLTNGLDPALMPTPRFSRFAFHDIAEIVALLKQMADSGVTLDRADDAVKAIFEFIGLPVPEVDPMADAARRDDAARRAGLGPRAAPTDDGSIDVNLDEET